jgi:hypothetical protein
VRDYARSKLSLMRLHEIADAPDPYLLTDSLVEEVIAELLQAPGNIRLSATECSHHQPAVSRNRTRAARPVARPTARPETSHSLGLPDLPDLSLNRETSSSSCEGRRLSSAGNRVHCLPPAELVGQIGQSGSWLKSRSFRRPRSGSRSGSARPARLDQSASPSSNAPLTT